MATRFFVLTSSRMVERPRSRQPASAACIIRVPTPWRRAFGATATERTRHTCPSKRSIIAAVTAFLPSSTRVRARSFRKIQSTWSRRKRCSRKQRISNRYNASRSLGPATRNKARSNRAPAYSPFRPAEGKSRPIQIGRGFMVSVAEILKGRHTGKAVELRGWIYRTRSVGGKAFVVVRDATGIVQVALSRDSVPAEAFAAAEKALIESAVVVHGKVVEDKRAPGGFEIRAEEFKVVHFAEKFPIQEDLSEEFLLDMEKIYYIGPSFRAEKSRTTRHLTEYWHAEMEQAWAGMDDVIKHAEGAISHACQRVAEERPDEVVAMGRTPEFLKAVKPPFERMTYDDELKPLKKQGMDIEWGKDLRTLEERALTEGKSRPIIVTHYPRVTQAFYKARDPKHPDLVLAFDVIGGGGP